MNSASSSSNVTETSTTTVADSYNTSVSNVSSLSNTGNVNVGSSSGGFSAWMMMIGAGILLMVLALKKH